MAEEIRGYGDASLPALLSKHIGETVTIFTKSGGQSGAGFTGVILSVNDCFVRLITRIGPPPACSLGNACTNFNVDHGYDYKNPFGSYDCGHGYGKGHGYTIASSSAQRWSTKTCKKGNCTGSTHC